MIVCVIVMGDFSICICCCVNDEVGQLMQVIQQMSDSLVCIVSNVCNSVNIIVIVMVEIVVGNFDLLVWIEVQVGFIEEIVLVME